MVGVWRGSRNCGVLFYKTMSEKLISKVGLIAGMGDALNARSFLVEYCKQKNIPRSQIAIYTERYWWMFDGMGFTRGFCRFDFRGLIGFKNFGNYDMTPKYNLPELDQNIAKNAGIEYSFEVRTPFPDSFARKPLLDLPRRYVTINTGYGRFSGKAGNPAYVCIKSWPIAYWERLVELLNIPVVQIGAGPSCEPVRGALNLINKTTIHETAYILKHALFHIDMEGGLPILMQHLGGRSVVLFGPTAIENQGRSFNLNLRANTCEPCYEWGSNKNKLSMLKTQLACKAHCMTDLKPEYVAEQINKEKWL